MKVTLLARSGVTAALYALLTLALAPISYGLVQCRVSEAMCVLPWFSSAAVPGLFAGCLLANLIAGAPLYDVVFGSLATLLAALLTRWMRRCGLSRYLAPLPSVVLNAVIVGTLLYYVYELPVSLPLAMLSVGAGQAVACYGLGIPLLLALERFGGKLFL